MEAPWRYLQAFWVYHNLAHEVLCKLGTCLLINELENTIKFMEDYKLAINHTIESTGLNLLTYMKKCPSLSWRLAHSGLYKETNCPAKQHPLIPEQGPSHMSFNAVEDIISV